MNKNIRNKKINSKYNSIIKTIINKIKLNIILYNRNKEEKLKEKINLMKSKFFSIIDKAVKKKILHLNNASRKKKYLSTFLNCNLINTI